MKRLAAHDLHTTIPELGRKDEIGGMAAAVQIFKDSMIETDRLNEESLQERKERENRAHKIEAMTKAFGDKIASLVSSLSGDTGALRHTASTMKEVAEGTGDAL